MTTKVNEFLFGAAYYDEYMPQGLDRIDEDMALMRAAGMNTIRIAESTWATLEPTPGVFDFHHVDRAIEAAARAGIQVIVGTPTYAVPAWLVDLDPAVLALTPTGQGHYGTRQNMDIVNPTYRTHAEAVIRALIEHVAAQPNVIGYQVDNETKYYDSVSERMQQLFVESLQQRFGSDEQGLAAMNAAFGLNYWSNRVSSWQSFPDVSGTINGSLAGAFDRFRRAQVAEFLTWQAQLVRQYARDDQFITHNFDYDWAPGWSYGLQPQVDHFKAAASLDIAGVDIYHPSEDRLTGAEIAFGGDLSRSLKQQNYLVIETQAQGQNGWLPYPGQLRLQAYSHLASGADGLMYWHWHSLHNSMETYWKGVLSQDFQPNPTYQEARAFGQELAQPDRAGSLLHLTKHNRVAIMVSNEALSALEWFHVDSGAPVNGRYRYNDVLRRVYDALFALNIECDFIPADASADRLSAYAMIIVPALYDASEETTRRLRDFVRSGGYLFASLRSFVADEDTTVWPDTAPHGLTEVFGLSYQQFTKPVEVGLRLAPSVYGEQAGAAVEALAELLVPAADTQVLATYEHPVWGQYAALTRHAYGRGVAEYLGTLPPAADMQKILREAAQTCGLTHYGQSYQPLWSLPGSVRVRQGINGQGRLVTYFLNYSAQAVSFVLPGEPDLTASTRVLVGPAAVQDGPDGLAGRSLTLPAWDVLTIEQTGTAGAVRP